MGSRSMRRICGSRGHDPIETSVLPFTEGAAIIGRKRLAEDVEVGLSLARWRNDWPLPRFCAILRPQKIAAQERKISGPRNRLLQFTHRLSLQPRPPITRAKNRAIAQLDHARILRTAKGMSKDQL